MVTKLLNLKSIRYLLYTLIVVGLLVSVFTPNYYLFIRGSQFANQIMLCYFFLGLIFLVFKQPKLTFTSFACCAGLCLFLKQSTNAEIATPVVTGEEIINVAHFNLSSVGNDYEQIINSIENTDAELISVQELTPDWLPVLEEAMTKKYPYASTIVRMDPYGIGIFSKMPLENLDTFYYEEIPNISANVSYRNSGTRVRFVAAHTTPPLFQAAHQKMRGHLATIAQYTDEVKTPMIVLGDFYAPPWCNEIQELKYTSGLIDSRRTAKLSVEHLFDNPVDYILHCEKLNCIGFESIDNKEFSHIGIKGAYQLKQNDDISMITK